MSRGLIALALAALLAACSTTPTATAANLIGTHDMVLVDRASGGSYIFVTSTDTNELRVLDLNPPGVTDVRQFVAAPNPLQALSIPVLDRPTALTADEGYSAGERVTGPYVYASRPGALEISVVGAADAELREVRRLAAPGPVTAAAGWFIPSPAQSRLYLATWDGTKSTLYYVDLPGDPDALRGLSATALIGAVHLVASFEGESVATLLVVPGFNGRTLDGAPFCAGSSECVVVATRRDRGAGGRTVMLDPVSLRTATLSFGGPVRTLATFGAVDIGDPPRTLQVGERIFALLDEEACGGPACGGALAVDTRTATSAAGFAIALDTFGLPMLPIRLGDSLPTGISLGVHGQLAIPSALSLDGGAGAGPYDVLGVVTASNGDIEFFDAARLTQLDTDSALPAVNLAEYHAVDGTVLDYVAGPVLATELPDGTAVSAVQITDGTLRTQQLYFTWQGTLPGLTLLPTSDSDGTRLTIPSALADRALVGDLVALVSGADVCGVANVTAVNSGSVDIDAVPATCSGRTLFTIGAGSAAPIVITSSLLGYLGRSAPGAQFVYTGAYVWRPTGFDPTLPSFSIGFSASTPTTLAPGSYWEIDIDAHFVPYVVLVDATTISCANAQVPATAIVDTALDRVFVGYPSANGVIEIAPLQFTPNATSTWRVISSSNGTICYR